MPLGVVQIAERAQLSEIRSLQPIADVVAIIGSIDIVLGEIDR